MMAIGFGVLVLLALLVVGVTVAVFSSMKGSKPVTWVLAGTLLLVLALGVAVLLRKPSHIEIEVSGPPGTAFVGEVILDGRRHEVDGTTPLSLEYQGREADYVFILIRPDGGTTLKVSVEGGYCTDNNGVKGGIRRGPPFGVGMSYWHGGMGDAEWDEFARRLIPPRQEPVESAQPIDGSQPAAETAVVPVE